jgi:fructose-bisphosphate aldolase, class II
MIVEIEVAVVGGEEDDIHGDSPERFYTTAEDLLRVAEVLGTGERGRYFAYGPGAERESPGA